MSTENKTRAATKPGRHPFYGTKHWDRLRTQALVRDAYQCQSCHRCEHKSRLHAHHVTPHRGDRILFFDLGNLRTLCELCHNTEAKQIETYGYSLELGADGYPLDRNHPFYR